MSFPPQFLDELRARLPASEVIGSSVRLTRRGREHSGLCPFHKEKTPSFTVNDEKAFFHCFGCGAHGDVIGYVMQRDGLSFPEAVERLAGQAGLEVPTRTPESRARAERQSGLYDVLELAAVWFQRALGRDDGATGLAYFKGRGIDPAIMEKFRLGWAPDRRGALKAYLAGEGIPEALSIEAGLLRRPDDGEPYDFFRGRVIFPIADARGRVIGFGGRALGDGQPKYINSPESDVFHKGRTLYNHAAAQRAARDAGAVIVAEGYMDVIAFARAGIDYAVAPLGTALTEDQIGVLWRLASEPLLCLDGDSAGRRAAVRAAERALPLLQPGRSLSFAFLPEGEDPDSLLTSAGPASVRAALERPAPLVEILWQQLITGRRADTPERRAGLRQALDKLVANVADVTVRAQYQTEFRGRFDAAFAPPRGRGRAARPGDRRRPGPNFQPAGPTPNAMTGDEDGRRRERIMLICLINHPALLEHVAEELAALSFATETLDRVRHALAEIAASGEEYDQSGLRAALGRYASAGEIDRLLVPAGWDGSHIAEAFARPEAPDATAEHGFRHLAILHRRRAVEADLRAAEAVLADTMSEEALAHLVALRHQLHDIDTAQEATFGESDREGLASRPLGPT
jgi:DNA primase